MAIYYNFHGQEYAVNSVMHGVAYPHAPLWDGWGVLEVSYR